MADNLQILLVEDDPALSLLIKEELKLKGLNVESFGSGNEALRKFSSEKYDICILDVLLPDMNGFEIAKEIRLTDNIIPIIFLTVKNQIEDKVEGFSLGADDYLTKPFKIEELYLRIQAIYRRKTEFTPKLEGVVKIGNYDFDVQNRILKHKEEERTLTKKEGDLLKLLCTHKNRLLERDQALNRIWGKDDYFHGRSMDVFITKLRKYLSHDDRLEIQNVHGIGFKLVVPE
ncbi:MAG: response regulator transcription factor [Flavobacteriales bacterium]|nr:response regulator transcription factor [Flavobacteriales bacterium]